MNSQFEQVSALADDELAPNEANALLDQMLKDPALFEQWEKANLQKEAVSGQLNPAILSGDLMSRISASLENEPAHFVDSAVTLSNPEITQESLWQRFSKPITGAAIAASVAVVTLISANLLQPNPGSEAPSIAQTPAAQSPVNNFPASTVAAGNTSVTDTPSQSAATGEQWITVEPALQQKLNPYLNGHSRYTVATGATGAVPAIRVVNTPNSTNN